MLPHEFYPKFLFIHQDSVQVSLAQNFLPNPTAEVGISLSCSYYHPVSILSTRYWDLGCQRSPIIAVWRMRMMIGVTLPRTVRHVKWQHTESVYSSVYSGSTHGKYSGTISYHLGMLRNLYHIWHIGGTKVNLCLLWVTRLSILSMLFNNFIKNP